VVDEWMANRARLLEMFPDGVCDGAQRDAGRPASCAVEGRDMRRVASALGTAALLAAAAARAELRDADVVVLDTGLAALVQIDPATASRTLLSSGGQGPSLFGKLGLAQTPDTRLYTTEPVQFGSSSSVNPSPSLSPHAGAPRRPQLHGAPEGQAAGGGEESGSSVTLPAKLVYALGPVKRRMQVLERRIERIKRTDFPHSPGGISPPHLPARTVSAAPSARAALA
jgi:hypothetical protein